MSEKRTIVKWWWVWDFDKEEEWLNDMALQGWALCEVNWIRFTFEKTEPGEYAVRTEMRPADADYVRFLGETGAEFVGRCFQWIYVRKKTEDGPFELLSDIDSRVAHLERICRILSVFGFANLAIGIGNSMNGFRYGWINVACATVLMYALGRIQGKKEALQRERMVHE